MCSQCVTIVPLILSCHEIIPAFNLSSITDTPLTDYIYRYSYKKPFPLFLNFHDKKSGKYYYKYIF